jgi:hypothetical protein
VTSALEAGEWFFTRVDHFDVRLQRTLRGENVFTLWARNVVWGGFVLFCFLPRVEQFFANLAIVLFVTVVKMLLQFGFFVKLFTAFFTGVRGVSPPSFIAESVSQRDVLEDITSSSFGCCFSILCCGEKFFSYFFRLLHHGFLRFLW